MPEAQFRETLSPELMVKTRVGTGGPQPAEVERMLAEARVTLDADKAWMRSARQRLDAADRKLNDAFSQLLR